MQWLQHSMNGIVNNRIAVFARHSVKCFAEKYSDKQTHGGINTSVRFY